MSASSPGTTSIHDGNPVASAPLPFKVDAAVPSSDTVAPMGWVLCILGMLVVLAWLKTRGSAPAWRWLDRDARRRDLLWVEERRAIAPGVQLQVVRYRDRRLLLALQGQSVSVIRDDEVSSVEMDEESADVV